MKRTISSILAVVMAMAMVLSFSAVAAENVYVVYECDCTEEEGCNHVGLQTAGCIATTITMDGNVITQTMDTANAGGGVGSYIAIVFDGETDIHQKYPYMVLDVKSNDGVTAAFYGWDEDVLESRPFSTGYQVFEAGQKYVANLVTGENVWTAAGAQGDKVAAQQGLTCQIWVAGEAGAEWSFELYFTDDPNAVGGGEGGAETGAESAIAVAAAAVIGAGALIVLSRKAK